MDLMVYSAFQRALEQAPYSPFFPARPVFAYHSGANAAANAMIDYFCAHGRKPMRSFVKGSGVVNGALAPNSFNVANLMETAAGAYWAGNTNTQSGQNAFNPISGHTGVNAQSNSFCNANVDIQTDGFTALLQDTISAATLSGMGVILGEDADYRQGIDLLKIAGNIIVGYTGDAALSGRSADSGFAWTALTGLRRLNTSSLGNGDIAYNRKTDTLAFIEPPASGNVYRLHIFKLTAKISQKAIQLKAMLEAAIAAGATRYETFDFTWTPATSTSEWHEGTRIIPCDDGSFFLAKMHPNTKLELAAISAPTGTRVFGVLANVATAANSFGRNTSNLYGIRHMNSDDGQFVAIFCAYSYYVCGICAFFVPRDAAGTTRFRRHQGISVNNGMSIAPCGGPNFIVGTASNADARSRDGLIVDLVDLPLDGSAIPSTSPGVTVSGFSQSTSYGGTGFVKVQPTLPETTEWNEAA